MDALCCHFLSLPPCVRIGNRCSLPPTLRSTPKERDFESAYRTRGTANDRQDAHLLWHLFQGVDICARAGNAPCNYKSRLGAWFPCRTNRNSFAIATGILFGFFSSAHLNAQTQQVLWFNFMPLDSTSFTLRKRGHP